MPLSASINERAADGISCREMFDRQHSRTRVKNGKPPPCSTVRWAICKQLQGLLFFVSSTLAVIDGAATRRYTPSTPSHAAPAEAPQGRASAASALPQAGPLKIPNAVLEPADWGDLDGWGSDDHAVAFATFYASCRPIVRAMAFRE